MEPPILYLDIQEDRISLRDLPAIIEAEQKRDQRIYLSQEGFSTIKQKIIENPDTVMSKELCSEFIKMMKAEADKNCASLINSGGCD